MKNNLALLAVLVFFSALLLFKSQLQDFVSTGTRNMMSDSVKDSIQTAILQQYNYHATGDAYQSTFIEFGAKNCTACKQMEQVMIEVKNKYTNVNVVFVNVALKENQPISRFFGITSIPSQVLLDRGGVEYFRHNGYIATKELEAHFSQ